VKSQDVKDTFPILFGILSDPSHPSASHSPVLLSSGTSSIPRIERLKKFARKKFCRRFPKVPANFNWPPPPHLFFSSHRQNTFTFTPDSTLPSLMT